jgi:hypothetical protein
MSKGRTLKDLGSLPNLFTPSEPAVPFAQALAEHDAQPEPVEDIDNCIVDLMRNYRGWTVGDVQRCLKGHPDVDLVPSLMNKFAFEGKFEIMITPARPNNYTLKKQPLTGTIAKPGKWVQREEVGVRQAPDPKGVIRLEDGIDVGIWKVMSDGKFRTKNEICAILSEYKFDRIQLNRRVDSFINSRNYFDRRTAGAKGMGYALKKHMPMPSTLNVLEQARPDVPSELTQITGNLSDQFMPSTKTAIAQIDEVIATARVAQQEHKVVHAAAVVAPVKPVVVVPVIELTDTMAQAAWKAISDHKPYRSAEVFMLLQTVFPDIKEQSLYARLSQMYSEGLLMRTPDLDSKSRGFIYTLKEGVPMPKSRPIGPKSQKAEAPVAETHQEPAQQELPVAQAQEPITPAAPQENIEMNKPSLVTVRTAAPAAPAAPLLDLNVRIKGEVFSLEECRQLTEELQKLGFGQNKHRPKTSLVEQSVLIKGVEFTADELDQIVNGLLAERLSNLPVTQQHRR